MSTLTPKSNNMLKGFIDDTPACTPIPQASSTATHRPGVSPPANMHYNDDAKTDLFLDGAIDGMKSIISKIQDAKLQLNECEKLSSARKESNISQGSRNPASEVNSSLGILKLDDLQGFSEYEFSNKMLFDENEEIRNTKIVDPELSDLAIDMRLRLQKELAQRAIHKAELLNSGVIDHVQPDALRNMESLGKLTQNPKVSLDGCSDIDTESQDISDYSSDEIENRIVNMSGLNLDGSLISEHETTSNFENFHNPFDSKNLDNETKLNMAAIIAEFSHEDFVPGEKCEGKLLADESIWKKENIPPTLGAISSPSLNLDFSGIVGNAEISLIPDKSVKDHKRKISVGEFFRLKSNVNASFGMPAKSPQKNHKLRPLAEVDESLHNTSANSKRTSVTNSKRDRSLRTEEESFARDSLSLSRIADILAQVDTCASPRTVVSNILKQSGLYGSKTKECGAQRDSVASSNHSFSVANISKMVSLKDHSNFTDQDKERLSINSSTEIKFPMNKSCASSQLSASENKSRNIFSNSTIKQSSKKVSNEDSKLKQRKGTSLEDDWLFTLPSANEGVGAKLHSSIMKHETETARREDSNLHSSIKSQRNYLSKSLNNSDRSIDRLTAVAESIASGDFDVLKLETVGANLDKSILDVTRGLCDLPRDSVDCSALVPVLYKEHPQLLRQEMSAANTIDCDSSINWSSLNCSTSTETSKSLDLKRETSFKLPEKVTTYQAVSNAKWVTIKIPTPVPYICVGVPEEIVLPIQNITDHWILCGIELISINLSSNEINENDQPALVHLPSKKVLMDPNNSKDAKIKIVPLCEGSLQICFKINLSDVVTKQEQTISCEVYVIGEEPQIEITNASGKSDLDFKTIPEECAQELALKCYNSGNASIPLRFAVAKQDQHKLSHFVLLDPDKQNNDEILDHNIVEELKFTITPGDAMSFGVLFAAPPMRLLTDENTRLVQLSGVLSIELVGIIPVELETINLAGSVGKAGLGIHKASLPLKIVVSECKKPATQHLPIRNNGFVPLTLTVLVLPFETDLAVIDVKPCQIELQPGEEASVSVSFTATKVLQEPISSALQITMQPLGPKFYVEVTGIFNNKMPNKGISKTVHEKLKSSFADKKKKIQNNSTSVADSQISRGSNSLKSYRTSSSQTSTKSPQSDVRSTKLLKSNSSKSSSSEKLNVRTTHRELIWGSVAVGKTVSKIFTVRNEEHFNMPAHLYIEDKFDAFKLLDQDGTPTVKRSIILRPMKSYTFTAIFRPYHTGAAYAKLIFIVQGLKLLIPLCGYGGHARLIAKGVPRDGAGRMWLMLYQHPHKTEWETCFELRNVGDVRAFIKIKPISKGFQNITTLSIAVEPSELVMPEGKSTRIKVKFQPQHNDLKFLMTNTIQDVVEVAALSLVSGDEATRLRLRSLHKQCLEAWKSGSSTPLLDLAPLCEQFPGEESDGAPNVTLLKDPQDSAVDLYSAGVRHQEIILLLENAIDSHGVDASRAFETMYDHEVDLSNMRFDDTDNSLKSHLMWEVTPSVVTLQPPVIKSMPVHLWTGSTQIHSFETMITDNPPGYNLIVSPNAGLIPTPDGINLTVSCVPNEVPVVKPANIWKGIIKIYTENEMKELNVCVQLNLKKEAIGHKARTPLVTEKRAAFHAGNIKAPSVRFTPSNTPFQKKTLNAGKSGSPNVKLESPRTFKKMILLDSYSSK